MRFSGADPRDGDPDRPLLLLLHGYGADELDLPPIVSHLSAGFDWVSLRAPISLPGGGNAWTPISGQVGEPEISALQRAKAAVFDWLDAYAPHRAVVSLGFSQGGLMAAELLRERPNRFCAAVVLSGFVSTAPSAFDAELASVHPPAFFGWGDADLVIPSQITRATLGWLDSHTRLTRREYRFLGHGISEIELADVSEFLESAVLGSLNPCAVPDASTRLADRGEAAMTGEQPETPAVDATARYGDDFAAQLGVGGRDLSAEEVDAIAALPSRSAILIVRRGPGAGARFLLDGDVTTAGRHPDADIFLDDVTVSRKHAEFHRTGADFEVVDLGSLNGTYVAGERIDRAPLEDGSEVQIGKYRMTWFASRLDRAQAGR